MAHPEFIETFFPFAKPDNCKQMYIEEFDSALR